MSLETIDKDMGAERIKRDLKKLNRSFVTVGVHDDAGKYTEGENPPDVVDVAFWNEFGTKRIPETPFIRSAIDVNLRKLNRIQERLLNEVMTGKKTTRKALDSLGFSMQVMIQSRISTTPKWAEPLATSTAAQKRRGGAIRGAIRLIKSGLLLRSITFDSEVR